jgi:hypothetical protein
MPLPVCCAGSSVAMLVPQATALVSVLLGQDGGVKSVVADLRWSADSGSCESFDGCKSLQHAPERAEAAS